MFEDNFEDGWRAVDTRRWVRRCENQWLATTAIHKGWKSPAIRRHHIEHRVLVDNLHDTLPYGSVEDQPRTHWICSDLHRWLRWPQMASKKHFPCFLPGLVKIQTVFNTLIFLPFSFFRRIGDGWRTSDDGKQQKSTKKKSGVVGVDSPGEVRPGIVKFFSEMWTYHECFSLCEAPPLFLYLGLDRFFRGKDKDVRITECPDIRNECLSGCLCGCPELKIFFPLVFFQFVTNFFLFTNKCFFFHSSTNFKNR